MREALLGKLLLLLAQAPQEQLTAVYRLLTGQPLPGPQREGPALADGSPDEEVGKRSSRRKALTENSALRTPHSAFDASLLASGATMARSEPGAQGGWPYVFRWTGRDWKVVFAGGKPFYLPDTLGARYVDSLLHHPNEPIGAFDLEVAITPEKGGGAVEEFHSGRERCAGLARVSAGTAPA